MVLPTSLPKIEVMNFSHNHRESNIPYNSLMEMIIQFLCIHTTCRIDLQEMEIEYRIPPDLQSRLLIYNCLFLIKTSYSFEIVTKYNPPYFKNSRGSRNSRDLIG